MIADDNSNANVTSLNQVAKRPAEDGTAASQGRKKRGRYTSIACFECKARKIKCNGETPCQRCANLSVDCVYGRNGNGAREDINWQQMNAKILALQRQVKDLTANVDDIRPQQPDRSTSLSSLHAQNNRRASSTTRRSQTSPASAKAERPRADSSRLLGPTSSQYCFNVAETTLTTLDIRPSAKEPQFGSESLLTTPAETPGYLNSESSPPSDPLQVVGREEVVRLIHVYEEEIGMQYPFLNVDSIVNYATNSYADPKPTEISGLLRQEGVHSTDVDDGDDEILKSVLAIAMVLEGHGKSELGALLMNRVENAALHRRPRDYEVNRHDLALLTLTSIYHFHCDEEILAWRMIGLVSRISQEAGLHRQESLVREFPDPQQRSWATKLFWCIYVLDRRWSFGTGLSFALQDSDIDPGLSEPDDSSLYLQSMVAYCRIASKVWRATASPCHGTGKSTEDERNYLDFLVLQWQQVIPPELRLQGPAQGFDPRKQSRGIYRLCVLLYLRANQMRMLIYRQTLFTHASITSNTANAQLLVELAKDSIRVLARLHETSDIYEAQQICFNHFLVSALAVLLLAVCHAPAQLSQLCRDEFHVALELVRAISTTSRISKRLWKTIEGFKDVEPKLGLARLRSSQAGSGSGPSVRDAYSSGSDRSPTNTMNSSTILPHTAPPTATTAYPAISSHGAPTRPSQPQIVDHDVDGGSIWKDLPSPFDDDLKYLNYADFHASNDLWSLFEADVGTFKFLGDQVDQGGEAYVAGAGSGNLAASEAQQQQQHLNPTLNDNGSQHQQANFYFPRPDNLPHLSKVGREMFFF